MLSANSGFAISGDGMGRVRFWHAPVFVNCPRGCRIDGTGVGRF